MPEDDSHNSNAEDTNDGTRNDGLDEKKIEEVEKLSSVGSDTQPGYDDEAPKAAKDGAGKSRTNLATLRTLESDAHKVLEEKDASMADIKMAEQEKKREEQLEEEKEQQEAKEEPAQAPEPEEAGAPGQVQRRSSKEAEETQDTQESAPEKAQADQQPSEREEPQVQQPQEQPPTQPGQSTDNGSGFDFSLGISIQKAIWSALILFFIASAAALFGYTYYLQDTPDTFVQDTVSPQEIIFANTRTEVDVTGKDSNAVLEQINNIQSQSIQPGAIENVYFTQAATNSPGTAKELLTARQFTDLLDSDIPASLVRTFSDQFMLGYHGREDGDKDAFLIFPINSYENAFAATLMWEGSMEKDLLPIIGPRATGTTVTAEDIATTTGQGATTTATTTQSQDELVTDLEDIPQQQRLLEYYTAEPFVDLVVRNRDTRVLRRPDDGVRLIYAFPRQQFLVITTSQQTLIEIFDRLSRRRFEQDE